MKYFTFFLLSIYCSLCISQVQVSNIQNFISPSSNDLGNKVGFAEYEGHNYLVIDNDSVQIFKLIDNEYKKIHVINDLSFQPSRSYFQLLNIERNYYIRRALGDLHIIDITTGEVKHHIKIDRGSISSLSYPYIFIYKGYKTDKPTIYYIDIGPGQLDTITLKTDNLDVIQLGSEFTYLSSTRDTVFQYSLKTKTSKAIFTSNSRIDKIVKSISSDRIYFSNKEGVYVIDEGIVNNDSCLTDLSNSTINDGIQIEGDCIRKGNYDLELQMTVRGGDSCKSINYYNSPVVSGVLNKPKISGFKSESIHLSVLSVEANIDYKGNHLFVNHKTKKALHFNTAFKILSDTFIEFKNRLYFIGVVPILNRTYSTQQLFCYDPLTNSINKVQDRTTDQLFSRVGYVKNDQLFFTSSFYDRSSGIFSIDSTYQIHEVKPIDISYNVGAIGVYRNKRVGEEFIFKCYGGVFNMNTNWKYADISEALNSSYWAKKTDLAIHDNQFAFVDYNSNESLLYIINNKTKEVIIEPFENGQNKISDPIAVGSMLLFEGDPVRTYDLKTGGWFSFETSLSLNKKTNEPVNMVHNDTSCIFLDSNNGITKLKILDLNSLELNTMDFNLKGDIKLEKINGDIKVIEQLRNEDKMHLYKLSDKKLELLYSLNLPYYGRLDVGVNSRLDIVFYERNDSTFMSFMCKGKKVDRYIKTDSAKSVEVRISNDQRYLVSCKSTYNGREFEVFDLENQKQLIKKIFSAGASHSFGFIGNKVYLLSEDDSFDHIRLFYYSLEEHEAIYKEIKSPYVFYGGHKELYTIDDKRILISLATKDLGSEPFVFNFNDMTLKLLKDMNSGENDSNCTNFFDHNGHIYFTARQSNKSVQWFKISIDSL